MENGSKNRKERFYAALRENLQKITIVIVSLVYIAQGLFAIGKKDASIWDILGSIGLSITVGMIIASNMNSMGLKDGRKDDQFVNSVKCYGETKTKATPKFDKLQSWCEYKNFRDLESAKKDLIIDAGLKWKAYKFGYYEEHKENLNSEQLKALEDVKHVKIKKLKTSELLSDLPKERHRLFGEQTGRFGEGEREYKARSTVSDFFSRVFISIVCGLYALYPLINGENVGEVIAGIIWNTLQIAMWISFGTLKYSASKEFMINEYRQTHIIQKTELLNEFIVTMDNNPSVIEDYDDEKAINEYIEEYIKEKEEKTNEQNEQETVLD